MLPPLNDELVMLIEKRFAGFYPHTKLMLAHAIDKSLRVIGSTFCSSLPRPMARCIIQQFQPRMDSNEELTKELWLAQKATLEAEIAGLYKQVELLEEVRDGLKRELDMVKSGAQKKKNAVKSEGGKASV